MDLKKGKAVVFLKLKMRFEEGVDLRAVTELRWERREDGRWEIVRFVGMRGMSGNMGFV